VSIACLWFEVAAVSRRAAAPCSPRLPPWMPRRAGAKRGVLARQWARQRVF